METHDATDVSATASLYNVLHISDFHRNWVDRGYLKAQDWNINILQGPERDRVDVLPQELKQQAKTKIEEHISWLEPQDHLKRAVGSYQGLINIMMNDDRSHLLKEFFRTNDRLDQYRHESFEQVFPELSSLRSYVR
jgi:hypothetical protein